MFVDFCGWMILYVCVCASVYVWKCGGEKARAWRGQRHDGVATNLFNSRSFLLETPHREPACQ